MARSRSPLGATFACGLSLLALVLLVVACAAGTEGPLTNGDSTEPGPRAAPTTSLPAPSGPTAPSSPGTPTPSPTATASTPDASPTKPSTPCDTVAPNHVCGVAPQCGCAANETCDVLDSTGKAQCIVAGTAAMGRPCTATAGCAAGLTCVWGTCHAYCPTAGAACGLPNTGDCVQVKGQGEQDVPNFKVCLVACVLDDPTTCGSNGAGSAACLTDGEGVTDCQSAGPKGDGETCTPQEDCGPGLVCVSTGAGNDQRCKRWCRVGTNTCDGGKACLGFQSKVVVAGIEYGACP